MTATEIRSLNRRNRGADGSEPRGASSPAPAVSASASSNSLSSVRSSSTFPVDSTTRGAVRPEGAGAGLSSATSSASLTGSVSESVDGANADEDAATAAPASAARTAYATPPAQAESPKASNRAGSGSSSGGAEDCHAIEVLNQECLELENENSALKEEIRDVWANYKALQDRTSAFEGELQALKLEHAALLGEKENSPEEAKIKALTHRLEDGRAREAKLESEVRRLNDLNGQLQEQVTEHYSVVSTLKNQEDERVLSLTQEHMRILKAAQSHAMELENRCAALSNTNADLYRDNQKLGDRLSKQTVDATIHADYTALESKHALLESKHAALDTQHAQTAERLRLAEERLTAAEAQCQQFSREKNETLYAHGVKVKELEQALAKAVRAGAEGGSGHGGEPHASTAMVNELQLQCSTLSQQIMKKQGRELSDWL
jgi:chromosome segregation ATPase